jgi:hypothetical protein
LRRYSAAADGAWRDHFRMMFQRECNRETKSGNDKVKRCKLTLSNPR